MPTTLTWHAIALRILLTVLAAGVIGFDRRERGRSAGPRTNILVALAACVAMVQTNLLINSTGKAADSFVVMDIMRLPLGILSGIGFIGAGAIVKRGEMVVGLTTAATLWFVTVMGLCFGGGQLGLGLAAFAVGLAVLSGFRKIENEMPREKTGALRLTVSPSGPTQAQIESLLATAGIVPADLSLTFTAQPDEDRILGWKLRWKARRPETAPTAIQELAAHPGVRRLEFTQ